MSDEHQVEPACAPNVTEEECDQIYEDARQAQVAAVQGEVAALLKQCYEKLEGVGQQVSAGELLQLSEKFAMRAATHETNNP